MKEYIAEKQNKIKRRVDSYILHGVPIKVVDEINFDLNKVIKKVENIYIKAILRVTFLKSEV